MKKRSISAAILVVLASTLLHAQWRLDAPLHDLVAGGIDLILKQQYARADSIFRTASALYPDHPAGYLYRAAVQQSMTIDYDVPMDQSIFDSLLEKGRSTAEEILPPWNKYFLAMANGYDAVDRVERGDWLGGVRKGMSSASLFEDLIEQDSSFYDAYVGIGTYYYWRSRKTEYIRWLPFVKDDRELGIRMLKIGADRSEYNRYAAVSALISIYLDMKQYRDVEVWSRRGLRAYPENRIFLWGLATALDRQNRPAEAAAVYSSLLENILSARAPHPYNEMVCRLNLVKSKIAVNDTTDVVIHLDKLISYESCTFPPRMQSRARGKIEEARKLLNSLEQRQTTSK